MTRGVKSNDSTLNFGRIESDYYWDADATLHRNRRRVTWLRSGVPRAEFSKNARSKLALP
jgi:predicted Mrr-cat superfamily restriction endonuclease